jgi:hypothetical protein
LTAAIGKDWADVLEGLPQHAIQAACLRYMRTETRRPTPAVIYKLAREEMPAPRVVASSEPEPQKNRITKERAAEIMAEAGFRVKRFGEQQNE